MATAAIFDSQKFKILTFDPLPGANMRHRGKLIKIGRTVAEIWRSNSFFSKWQPFAILDLLGAYGTTHDYHLMVHIVMPNLVKIDAVVSIR